MEHGSARIGEIFDFGMLHLEWTTALFILVVFVVTIIFLNSLLFKPVLRTLELRQSGIDKSTQETEALTSSCAKAESNYESKLIDVREKIQLARQSSLDEALENSRRIIGETKDTIAAKLEEAEKELIQERENALREAASLTEGLAQLIKSKVLA
ncbi:MAG: ATP synthase F0 subunit B [Deltaproteobacteria bacterium]|jgi:F0F1-type ATP synthase membrane subunit b/b'|nr:ATP synthase F0 subunit B [Deltaproteobacteria bacterium]MBT7483699.1 ATP synthase F0 subunit B [Candidatus Peregrinibacteria bacterium]MBT4089132.1 ATP synthase F0 subunit B [Deltaproteobacteria bacterium]MBT4263917.1 ATP synthase F0 subunit B [Deltaproteobacteria bacterium]MBT4639860.1 ATP synthase F0 subunit B [Deltaproteobacteria bacterium]